MRLIIDGFRDPYENMALDEAMLILRQENKIPDTLRLYRWRPSSVTIGYFQKIREVVNLEYANLMKIPVVRRITGGGAVYHDELGEITYAIVMRVRKGYEDIEESYRRICRALIYALESIGLKPMFKPVNDIIVNGKKISGSAQIRRKNVLLQHGTLLVSSNLEVMGKVLKPPKIKLKAHGVVNIKEWVTAVSIALGRYVKPEELIQPLVEGFKKALKVDLIQEALTEEEIELANKLKSKYKSREWNFLR